MDIARISNDHIKIRPESAEEQAYLEKQLGWVTPKTLLTVICKLEAYEMGEGVVDPFYEDGRRNEQI